MKAGIFHVLTGHWCIAAEICGLDVVWAHEDWMKVGKFFKINRPDIPFTNDYEVFKRKRMKVFTNLGDFANIIVGSPSGAGLSAGNPRAKPQHTSNQKVIRFAETVDLLQPQAFIMEAISTLKTSKKFRPLYNRYREILSRHYRFTSSVLQLHRYGSPTKRKRVFFIGFHWKLGRKPTMPPALNTVVTARQVFRGLPNPTEDEAVAEGLTHRWNPEWKGPFSALVRDPDYFTLPEDKPGRTFTAVGGVYFRHPDNHRAITKAEAKRLMGLPDDWEIPAAYSMVVRACAWGVPVMSLVPIINHVVGEMKNPEQP